MKVPSTLLRFRSESELVVTENGIKHIGHRLEKLVAQYTHNYSVRNNNNKFFFHFVHCLNHRFRVENSR